MADIFPNLRTTTINDARPGSILKMPRSEGELVGLATEHLSENGTRSVVLLNARFERRPAVIFARQWRFDPAICIEETCEFELDISEKYIDWRSRISWETAGVILSINDDLYIRAANTEEMFGGNELVNIRTGALYAGQSPNTPPTICAWNLHVLSREKTRKIPLCNFRQEIKD